MRGGDPGESFPEATLVAPECCEREHHSHEVGRLVLAGEYERGADVGVLLFEPAEPRSIVTADEVRCGSLHEGEVVGAMPLLKAVEVAAGGKSLQPVVAHGLHEPVAVARAALVDLDHRLGDEIGDQVEQVERVDRVVGDDGLGRFERELAREHREALEDDLFPRLKQPVGPVNRSSQGLMTSACRATSLPKQPEPLVHAGEDRGGAHRRDARGRELNRQWDAVEAPTQLTPRPPSSQRSARTRRARPPLARQRDAPPRPAQWPHRTRHLAVDAEHLLAGGDNSDPRAATHYEIDDTRNRVHEMLAIVEHHERVTSPQRTHQRFLATSLPALGKPHRGRNLTRDEGFVIYWRKVDEPCAVRKAWKRSRRSLNRQPCLPHTTSASERHDPCLLQRAHNPIQVLFPAHERGDLDRQIPRQRVQRSQRRKLRRQSGRSNLKDALGTRQVTQPMLAQIDQIDILREAIAKQLFGRMGHHDLAAVRNIREPRGRFNTPP